MGEMTCRFECINPTMKRLRPCLVAMRHSKDFFDQQLRGRVDNTRCKVNNNVDDGFSRIVLQFLDIAATALLFGIA